MVVDKYIIDVLFANRSNKWTPLRIGYVLRKLVGNGCLALNASFFSSVIRARRFEVLTMVLRLECDPTVEQFRIADDALALPGVSRTRACEILASHPRVRMLLAPVAGHTIQKKMKNFRAMILDTNQDPITNFAQLTIA